MKLILSILLSLNFLFAEILQLTDKEAKSLIDERIRFFIPTINLAYDKNKIQKDTRGLEFIDLCKYPVGEYKFPCGKIIGEFQISQLLAIGKYFIKAESITEVYPIFEDLSSLKILAEVSQYNFEILSKIPQYNCFYYDETKFVPADEVGTYYIWDNEKRLWIIAMDLHDEHVFIYTQKKDLYIYGITIDKANKSYY